MMEVAKMPAPEVALFGKRVDEVVDEGPLLTPFESALEAM
jgi:hypothetical protein